MFFHGHANISIFSATRKKKRQKMSVFSASKFFNSSTKFVGSKPLCPNLKSSDRWEQSKARFSDIFFESRFVQRDFHHDRKGEKSNFLHPVKNENGSKQYNFQPCRQFRAKDQKRFSDFIRSETSSCP